MLNLGELKKKISQNEIEEGKNIFEKSEDTKDTELIAIQNKNIIFGIIRVGTKLYKIKLNTENLENKCSCKTGGNCRHVFALALKHINEPDLTINFSDVLDTLADCDKDTLVSVMGNLIRRHPHIIQELIRNGIVIPNYKESQAVKEIRKHLERALSNINYGEIGESFDTRYDEAVKLIEQLVEEENYDDAFVCYIYLLDAIVEAVKLGYAEEDVVMYSLTDDVEDIIDSVKEILPNVSKQLVRNLMPRIEVIVSKDIFDLGIADLLDAL